jgi:hypothetical protein
MKMASPFSCFMLDRTAVICGSNKNGFAISYENGVKSGIHRISGFFSNTDNLFCPSYQLYSQREK